MNADPTIRVIVNELACCALEVGSAMTLGLLEPEQPSHESARVTVMLVSGTVTEILATAVRAQWEQIAEPKLAIAIGACASSGGPYWDAPTVVNGVDRLIPTGGFIAGCPPSPHTIVDGVVALASVI